MGALRKIAQLPRWAKRCIVKLADGVVITIALFVALSLAAATVLSPAQFFALWPLIVASLLIKTLVFHLMGLHRRVLRYISPAFLLTTLTAVLASTLALGCLSLVVPFQGFSFQAWMNDAVWTFALIVGVRFLAHQLVYALPQQRQAKPLIIYGAGAAGFQLAQALYRGREFRVVAFVDDNPQLQANLVYGVMVYSPALLPRLVSTYQVDTLLLAMPSVSRQKQAAIVQSLALLPVSVQTVPSLEEIVSGRRQISQLCPVNPEELLRRAEVLPDQALLDRDINHKVVLVTGAGGSIGSELCRQIAAQGPACLVLYELNEFALYKIDLELRETFPDLVCVACLGSVTDPAYLAWVLDQHGVQTIYHAAAYKHVPLVEHNVAPAILNNIYGTQVVVQAAQQAKVGTFVLISTDKAVRPTNVMGASKRVAELVVQAAASGSHTRFSIVRFGNVLGSTGSVIPRFREQIEAGKALTVTHREITRYFMSIPEAARLVIQAGSLGQGGEVFLLDMGEPVRIYDLARQMIQLSGLRPDVDIPIEITGLRPGEKLYEELLIDRSQAKPTQHPKIFMGQERGTTASFLGLHLDGLLRAARQQDEAKVKHHLRALVPEYQPKPAVTPLPLGGPMLLPASSS
ncbi:nucleoside-diphosphate sugar epimerase/dehydratase [Nodosilinea sp. P-1105]|uniref:polysaccharide biosynthesis protein n=1 Tax=Nodosilinea sp. P-1105 TaxID=2546229 RepID=UPI00146D1FFB|nr:nucleoside-diphosphate sugar epimerase/dehydratase [Nodosilinea sp. P-1105]